MRQFKVCFYLFLFVTVFGLLLYPSHDARAVVGVKFISCAAGGLLAPWLSNQINTGIDNLLFRIPALDRFLSGAGGVLGGDVPVADKNFLGAWTNKTLRADILARCTAREIFNAMSKGIVDNARTAGRSGGPAFVRNWRNFQTDAQYRGEGIFRAMLSNTKLCDYFEKDIKGLFGADKKLKSLSQNLRVGNFDPFKLRANCTMPSNFNLANYQKDFAGNGGWKAWSRMLEPQNNYYGALFGSLDEAAAQRNLEQSADLNQVIANKGFTGRSGKGFNDSCKTKDENGKCLEYKDIKTPGTVISDSVAATIQQELAWITNVHSIGEIISAATEVLLNRLTDLSNPNEGDYTVYNGPQISNSPTEEPVASPPADALIQHPNQSSVVAAAKDKLIGEGMIFSKSSPECPDRFAIIKRAVQKLGGGAGFLDKPRGNNCEGKAADIVALPDGYAYNVLDKTASDGNGPIWSPSACGTIATNGTCPDRYRAP